MDDKTSVIEQGGMKDSLQNIFMKDENIETS